MTLKPREDLLAHIVDGEVVVLDRLHQKVHQLNATASYIWTRCDGSRSAEQIADGVAENFEVAPETALKDVTRALAELEQLGLLVGV